MTHIFITLALILLPIQVAFANCAGNIPGHYENRFIDNKDGTLTDSMTGLIWSKCVVGATYNPSSGACDAPKINGVDSSVPKFDWQSALQLAEADNTGGQSDWRLPNIKELASLLEPSCLSFNSNIAFNTDYFNRAYSIFWSSTPSRKSLQKTDEFNIVSFTNQAWSVNFQYAGGPTFGARELAITDKNYVRTVRGVSTR